MEYVATIVVAALVFGLCYLVDKGFTRFFRGQVQHQSGLSIRLNKKYGAFGLILAVLGIAALFAGIPDDLVLAIGGGVVIAVGVGLVIYYMTFGIFYDEDSFVYTSFGKRSVTYDYKDIQSQQLYNASGNIVVELHMKDGKTVDVQSAMKGADAFLDKAFAGWCSQRGIAAEECSFYDPANSCWFPSVEGK